MVMFSSVCYRIDAGNFDTCREPRQAYLLYPATHFREGDCHHEAVAKNRKSQTAWSKLSTSSFIAFKGAAALRAGKTGSMLYVCTSGY